MLSIAYGLRLRLRLSLRETPYAPRRNGVNEKVGGRDAVDNMDEPVKGGASMTRWIAVIAILLGLLIWHAEVEAACSSVFYTDANGMIHSCTTCCTGGFCTTSCT